MLFRSISNTASSRDTIKVVYTSGCNNSAPGISVVTLPAFSVPSAPTVTATNLVTNVCGARVVRYVASVSTSASVTGYAWVMPIGTLGSTCVLDSGSLTGSGARAIRIRYTSNAAAGGDTVKVAFTSG